MGIQVNNNRYSNSFIGTFNFSNDEDMKELQLVKNMVRTFNRFNRERGSSYQWRVCLRGRKPYKKMKVDPVWHMPNPVGKVSYDQFGNIVGGIRNASCADVYIYRKS